MFVSRTLFESIHRRVCESYPARSISWSRNIAALVVADVTADAIRMRTDLVSFARDLDAGSVVAVDGVRAHVHRTAAWMDEIDPRERVGQSSSPILRDLGVALTAADELGATIARIASAPTYTAESHAWVEQAVCTAEEFLRGLRDIERRGKAELARPHLSIVENGHA